MTTETIYKRWPHVKLAIGEEGVASSVSAENPLPVVVVGGDGGSSSGLTDTELRASPLSIQGVVLADVGIVPVVGDFYPATQPISGTVTVANSSFAVTGPLTDVQLRAAPVPVSGTVAVTGPLTDTQLRAAVVPISGTVTITPPTLTKGTQGATGLSVQNLKDAGRAIVNAATAIAGVTAVTTEALLTLAISRDGAGTSNATTIAVTSGKRLRIIGVIAGVISTAAAVISARVSLRMNPGGSVAANSPILAILPLSQQAAALAQAGDTCVLMFPEAIEISGTMQVGLSQIASVTSGTIWASLIGYEY